MKITQALALLLLAAGSLFAQQQPTKEKAQAQLTFHVVTDDGKPVPEVEIAMATFHHLQPGEGFGQDVSETFTGITDNKGFVTVTGQSLNGGFRYGPRPKPGFYRGGGGEYQFKEKKDSKWQPWNPTLEVVFKPIIKPIPMYGRKVGFGNKFLELPQKNQAVGFDLMAGDWVAPYGKGSASDLLFTLTDTVPFVSAEKPYDETLTITFGNKGDGIQSVLAPINQGSDLRVPRYAPEDGYEPQLVKQMGRPAEGKPINPGTREDQNFFFRVRTVLDDDGKIKSALYGKIDGDITCDVINSKTGLIQLTYCLNPNPNDRNMEFNPKQNLVGDLPIHERVIQP